MRHSLTSRNSDGAPGIRPPSLWRWLAVAALAAHLQMFLSCTARHVHVQIEYTESQWALFVYDFAVGRLPAATTPLPVSSRLQSVVPDDPRYTRFLGSPGQPVWILPANARPGEISMGVGTSRIAPNVFSRNEVFLSLQRVDGPGRFTMYNADLFGTPEVIMSTSDGVNPTVDRLPVPALAGHLHMNWAFTAPGIYRLGFVASGVLRSGGQLSSSPVVDFTFVVEQRPELLSPRSFPRGFLSFTLQSATNTVCRLETSANLQDWSAVRLVTNTTGVTEVQLSADTNAPIQFFRAVIP
ncbi:MAG: hypothetical protein FJ405_00445 [Verrucomicrobia bacterium]|nr:hypothetical protein [Verrucomicrobiota bacterium]